MIIGEVSIAPLGVGTSVSKYVREAVKVIKSSGLTVRLGGMSTTIEAPDLDTLFRVIKDAEEAEFRAGARRVLITLKVDDRRDKAATIESKIQAVDK
ncbi:MTH1187 family thiamine-binding protein [[Eubacterium] cellulosolvens]